MEYIVFSYKKKARSEIFYSFGDYHKNNSKRGSFDSLFLCEKSHIYNKEIYKYGRSLRIVKSEKLTEYFVKYMNCVASYCNAKAQEPLYIKNNLIHKTWEFQNELMQFEKEISDEILADNVLFGSYSLLYELSYKIKDEMLGFLRDSSLDINFFDNFSSVYHHFLEVIDHYIQWKSVREEKLMQFGFCKVGVEEIFLIPYYIFSIVPETFEFVNLYGCAIKKKRIPVSSQELILGCLPYGIMLKEI